MLNFLKLDLDSIFTLALKLFLPFKFFLHQDFASVEPQGEPGLIICNPPYGKRLGKEVRGVYYELGRLYERFQGWRLLFLAPSASLAKCVSPNVTKIAQFSNGGIEVGAWALNGTR